MKPQRSADERGFARAERTPRAYLHVLHALHGAVISGTDHEPRHTNDALVVHTGQPRSGPRPREKINAPTRVLCLKFPVYRVDLSQRTCFDGLLLEIAATRRPDATKRAKMKENK